MAEIKEKYYEWHPPEIQYRDYLDFFNKKKPVLDLGCGTGWLGRYHKDMYGLDIDHDAIKQATKFEKATVHDIAYEKWPFSRSFFEGIIAKDIIEHLPSPIFFMSECSRLLKKNGLLYVATKLPSFHFWDDYTHIRPYNKQSLVSLFEDNGFDVLKIWYTGNWPGLGIIMKLLRLNKTPFIFNILTKLGLNRNNICILARKK